MSTLLDKTNILLKQIAEITSFDAVAKWDNEAKGVLELLKKDFDLISKKKKDDESDDEWIRKFLF